MYRLIDCCLIVHCRRNILVAATTSCWEGCLLSSSLHHCCCHCVSGAGCLLHLLHTALCHCHTKYAVIVSYHTKGIFHRGAVGYARRRASEGHEQELQKNIIGWQSSSNNTAD